MIPYAEPVYFGNEKIYVMDAVQTKWISGGMYVDKFEKALADYLEQPVITTSNGTTALELAYLGLDLKGNIIVPAFGFMAAANVAYNFNITPNFADVLPDTWNLDPDDVRKRINKNTTAIVAIHNYGNMCDMFELVSIARQHGLSLIEDCAESIFSMYWNMKAGTMGDVGTYSFHATKTITTGEGGAVSTKLPGLDNFFRTIRNHGMEKRGNYNHAYYGMNFRLSNIHAAMGAAQMEYIADIYDKKRKINYRYLDNLSDKAGITTQKITANTDPLFWTIAVKLGEEFPEVDDVISKMRALGVEIRPGFLSPTYLQIYVDCNTPVADALSKRVISLPCSLSLTDKDIDDVCRKLLECRE